MISMPRKQQGASRGQRNLPPGFRAWLLVTVLACSATRAAELPVPDPAQLAWLGEQIFRNECNSRRDCLTAWNAGEDFPSLGIGHFIWYRADQRAIFAETFPELLAFMQQRGAVPPAWLADVRHEQPWPDRAAFNMAGNDPRMIELRDFLAEHMDLQTAFIVSRFDAALAKLLATTPAERRDGIEAHFVSVANTAAPHGLYALIDYINFKGEGISPAERYQDQGWGLLQVLQGMQIDAADPLAAFVGSARTVLARRVALAPPDRQEQRWLAGWNKRLDTYLPAPPMN